MSEIHRWGLHGRVAETEVNAVFIHIPKAAGLYIQEALGLSLYRFPHRAKKFNQEGMVTFGHLFYPKLLRRGIVSAAFDKSAFKFAFCRNPYDRAVSHYHYVRYKHPDILDPATSFLDFTRNLPMPLYGKAFRPQSDWIKGVKIDTLGRFETLVEDLDAIAGYLGVDIMDIPPRNPTEHEPYQSYYCEESKRNIEHFYAIDFETFGYEYDNHLLHGQ